MTTVERIVGGRILSAGDPQTVTITHTGPITHTGTITHTSTADAVIESITPTTTRDQATRDQATTNTVDIDAAGLTISPGFIDLQINGGYGNDLVSDPTTMWDLGDQLPRHGVTAFLPTIISSPPASTAAALDALRHRPAGYRGAEPLGIHFEGPMLSQKRPGAHPKEHLVQPSHDVIDGWSRDNGVVLVTVAPELPGAAAIIGELAGRGVIVSAGHSNATADQAQAGLAAGVSMVTHLFNAMAPLGHRDPNLIGVALAADELPVGLIVDGVHVDPVVVAAAWNAKGPHGVILVTDAVAPMGQGPGRYEFARTVITADDRCVRNAAGTLAGSILTMDQALRNLIAYTGCGTDQAIGAATANPADLIGDAMRGRIQPGTTADFALLDQNLEVQITVRAGRIAYVADGAKDRISANHGKAG